MNLGTHLYLPKHYPCAEFGRYSSISDVTTHHQCFFDSDIEGFEYVNQVLFRYENFASIFIRLFGRLELHFNQKIAESLKKLSNAGLQNH